MPCFKTFREIYPRNRYNRTEPQHNTNDSIACNKTAKAEALFQHMAARLFTKSLRHTEKWTNRQQ